MSMQELLPVLKQVFTNKYVIITAVAVFLYMNFCAFVANYEKKPKRPKKKMRAAPAPIQQPQPAGENAEDGDTGAE